MLIPAPSTETTKIALSYTGGAHYNSLIATDSTATSHIVDEPGEFEDARIALAEKRLNTEDTELHKALLASRISWWEEMLEKFEE